MFKSVTNFLNKNVYCFNNLHIAVAVSGGVDSIALALLLQQWCNAKLNSGVNIKLTALVVNHNIRHNSTEEAQYVSSLLNKLNINNVVLNRQPKPLNSKLQQSARVDRYALLQQYCYSNAIPYLFIAHHKNDVKETTLMRKQKGSNLIGLAGISGVVITPTCTLLRPLLTLSKKTLVQYVTKQIGRLWVEDPSNTNTNFTRVTVRNQLASFTQQQNYNLLKQITSFKKQRQKLENQLTNFIIKHVSINNYGVFYFKYKSFKQLSPNAQLYVVYKMLQAHANAFTFTKLHKINNVVNNLNNNCKAFTLNSSIFTIQQTKQTSLVIVKPNFRLPPNLMVNNNFIFVDYTINNSVKLLQSNNTQNINTQDTKHYFKSFYLQHADYSNLLNNKNIIAKYSVFIFGNAILSNFFY